MKLRNLSILLFLIFSGFYADSLWSQCNPASPEQCPDPENNGQICPDSLTAAGLGQFYSQVATIKPPLTYFFNEIEIPLHHVKLMEVGNLPAGLTWISNAPDSNFTAGEYYCVLLEGTPIVAGDYHLRIVVDVYVPILDTSVWAAQVIDSTSLTLVVLNDSGIQGNENNSLIVRQNVPNPFLSDTRIDFYSEITGIIDFEVYTMMGQKVYYQKIGATKGENSVIFNGQMLPEGSYFYLFRFTRYKSSGIMIRKY